YMPKPEDINLEGLDLTTEDIKNLLTVDKESWKAEIESIEAFYNKIGKYPEEMQKQIDILKKNILG
ncbi:MAG: phosphoenolpyruvate carboxykinase (GTP), partial [Clostridia bacterium]|nr:phosphoenolpyruvate carboxykinase (GTP) [Clostridia bacterium]